MNVTGQCLADTADVCMYVRSMSGLYYRRNVNMNVTGQCLAEWSWRELPSVCLYVSMYVFRHVYSYVCVCIYICVCVCRYSDMCTVRPMHGFSQPLLNTCSITHIHTRILIRMHMYTYAFYTHRLE
jgi:hypothetical protein